MNDITNKNFDSLIFITLISIHGYSLDNTIMEMKVCFQFVYRRRRCCFQKDMIQCKQTKGFFSTDTCVRIFTALNSQERKMNLTYPIIYISCKVFLDNFPQPCFSYFVNLLKVAVFRTKMVSLFYRFTYNVVFKLQRKNFR